MKQIPVDEARFGRANLGFKRRAGPRGEVYRFELPDRTNVVEAEVVGTELVLVPERSADHRAVLALLEATPVSVGAAPVPKAGGR